MNIVWLSAISDLCDMENVRVGILVLWYSSTIFHGVICLFYRYLDFLKEKLLVNFISLGTYVKKTHSIAIISAYPASSWCLLRQARNQLLAE